METDRLFCPVKVPGRSEEKSEMDIFRKIRQQVRHRGGK